MCLITAVLALTSKPVVVPLVNFLGFTCAGIAAGSWAAGHMASYGGVVSAGSTCAILQTRGATDTLAVADVKKQKN